MGSSDAIIPKDILKIIVEVCAIVQSNNALWPRLIGDDPKRNAQMLIAAHIHGVYDVLNKTAKTASITARATYQPQLTVLDLAVTQFVDLFTIQGTRESAGQRLLWEPTVGKADPDYVFVVFLTNLLNSILSVRQLVLAGFNGPARIIYRSFVETSDLAIAVLGDRELFDLYTMEFEDERQALQHWRLSLSPERIRQRISDIECRIGSAPMSELSYTMRKDAYRILSATAHNQWDHLMLGAHTPSLESDNEMISTLGGQASELCRGTLSQLIRSTFVFLAVLRALLVKEHSFRLNPNDIFEVGFIYRWEVFQATFLRFHDEFGIVNDLQDGEIE